MNLLRLLFQRLHTHLLLFHIFLSLLFSHIHRLIVLNFAMSSEIREMIILKNKEIVKESLVSLFLKQTIQMITNKITRSRTFQIYYTFRLNKMVEIFSRICLNTSEMKLVACIRNHGNSTRFSTGYNFSCNFDNIFYAKGRCRASKSYL